MQRAKVHWVSRIRTHLLSLRHAYAHTHTHTHTQSEPAHNDLCHDCAENVNDSAFGLSSLIKYTAPIIKAPFTRVASACSWSFFALIWRLSVQSHGTERLSFSGLFGIYNEQALFECAINARAASFC